MFKNIFKCTAIAATVVFMMSVSSAADEVPIEGNVASKCVIYPTTAGVYGNPLPDTLTTDVSDGGKPPIIRFDVVNANSYKAVITTPITFSSSPSLNDTLAWTGSVEVDQVTDSNMSSYDSNKRVFNNITEFDLTVAGTVWFKANSTVTYGYNKSLPGGNYKSIVVAECIAL